MSTGQNIADEVRRQLNDGDSNNYRWSDAELLDYINAAQRQIVALLPEANVVEETVQISTTDPRRTLPAGGVKFIGAWNYDASASKRGPVLSVVEMGALDSAFPEWSYPNHQAGWLNQYPTFEQDHSIFLFEHVMHDPRDPKTYYLFPPPSLDEIVLLGSSGVFDTYISESNQTRDLTYVLPDGTDNRMIVVTGMMSTSTTHRDLDDLVISYGGVQMNVQALTWSGETYDGVDIGHFIALLSVNGQTFNDDDLTIDATAWDGTISPNIYPLDIQIFVFDNVTPGDDDFSAGYQEEQNTTASIDLTAISFSTGDLLFSHAVAGKQGADDPGANELTMTTPSSFTYDADDMTTSSYVDTFFCGRVGYSLQANGSVAVTWAHAGSGTLLDPSNGWGTQAVKLTAQADYTPTILLRYSKLPDDMSSLSDTYGLGDEYQNAAVEYVTFRALMKDGRYGNNPERRMELWNNFRMTLGLKPEVERRVDVSRGRAGGDANG